MEDFYSIPIEERETLIDVDYFSKKVNVYTTRVASMKKLIEILGEPKLKGEKEGKIDSMEWDIPFEQRENIKKSLSLSALLPTKKGQIKADD